MFLKSCCSVQVLVFKSSRTTPDLISDTKHLHEWSENTVDLLGDSNDSLSQVTYCETLSFIFFAVVMASPQRFLGNSLLQWNNLAAASVPWHVELMFRTRQASATLLHISSGQQHNLTLQVSNTHTPKKHTNTLCGYTLVAYCLRPSCIITLFCSMDSFTVMLQYTVMSMYLRGNKNKLPSGHRK